MVCDCVRKTKQRAWNETAMCRARYVTEENKGYKKTSLTLSVPALGREVRRAQKNPKQRSETLLGSNQTVFSTSEKDELVKYLSVMESRLFGLTSKELRNLASKLAEKNRKKFIF
jgi:hypothetical protein